MCNDHMLCCCTFFVNKCVPDMLEDLKLQSEEGSAGSPVELAGSSTELTGSSMELTEPSTEHEIDTIPEDVDNEYIPDMTDSNGEEDEDEVEIQKPKKRVKLSNRQRWSFNEVEELKTLFQNDFETLKLPGQYRIEQIMKQSCANHGEIHKRKRDTIKKKLSNMMLKQRRN